MDFPRTQSGLSVYDRMPETSFTYDGVSVGGDLVLFDGKKKTTLYDCDDSCYVTDPEWSLDNQTVWFSVVHCPKLETSNKIPQKFCDGDITAELHTYHLASGKLTIIPPFGPVNVSPVPLPNGRVMFLTTKAGVHRTTVAKFGSDLRASLQLATMLPDGSDARLIGPHEFNDALHPQLFSDGDVCYSVEVIEGMKLLDKYSFKATDPDNDLWVGCIDQSGGDFRAMRSAHERDLKAKHYLTERANGDMLVTEYYRKNNNALGEIQGWPKQPSGVEGDPSKAFEPVGLYNLTTWSGSADRPFAAKVGFPEGLADKQVLLSVGKGGCSSATGNPDYWSDQPVGCDIGIYKTTVIPSQSPNDLQLVVDDPSVHEVMARVPHFKSYPIKEYAKRDDSACIIGSSMTGGALLEPPAKFADKPGDHHLCSRQGCKAKGINILADMDGIRLFEAVPNTTGNTLSDGKSWYGVPLKIVGDIPLNPDKSFVAQVPCDVPLVLAGTKQGRVIARDDTPFSLRKGEERICSGCHGASHAVPITPTLQGTQAGQQLASGNYPKLFNSLSAPTWQQDIQSISNAKCGGASYNAITRSFDGDVIQHIHRVFAVESAFPNDLCTGLTDGERGIIATWLETGTLN